MSRNWSAGLKRGRVTAAFRAVGVLGLGAAMLGAHHRVERTRSAPVPPVPAAAVPSIHLGAGDAVATRAGWSPARSFRLVSAEQFGRFRALDSAQQQTVLKLNRVDAAHARRRTLVVPDSIAAELDYAPLPGTIFALRAVPKMVVVSRRVQAFGAYEHGVLVRWGPTSTGKTTTPTDTGLFFTNWKDRQAISTDDPSWILDWYVNFIALKGVAFHQYAMPGFPASHGCVRLLEEDARWMFGWTDSWVPGRGSEVKRYGTPVLVFGDWERGAPAPWLDLADGGGRSHVSSWELGAALAPQLEQLLSRAADPATEVTLR